MLNKIILAIAVIATLIAVPSNVYAKSPYQSGYDHGCDDSDLSPQDRYINEKGKGPSFHTTEFMNGYDAGFVACSGNGNNNNNNSPQYYEVQTNTAIDDSNFDDHSVSQPQNQEANTNQAAGCPQQIINGDCIIGQSQNTNNEFAQANRNN